MGDLLIAVALDLAGQHSFHDESDRIAGSMLLGKAGDVRQGLVEGARLFSRDRKPVPRPRVRQGHYARAEDGGYTLFAGRLFERDALAHRLGRAKSDDDADLYAAAHRQWGEECDGRLLGDYAAIRWFPGRRAARLARSPSNENPLHVWRRGSLLVAASVPRVLFSAGADDRLSDDALADMLLLAGPAPYASVYAECARVPSATVVAIDPHQERRREYWSIADVPEVRFKRDGDYVEAVEEQFSRSLREHLAGIQRPAVALSGGLDSQAVAAFALEAMPAGQELRSYTAVPMAGWTPPDRPWAFGDESAHVRAFAALHPQVAPTFLDGADARFGETLEMRTLLSSWPQLGESNAHWGMACDAQAVADGCDAILRGDAGNMGFSYDGATGYSTWFAQLRWGRLFRELSASSDPRLVWRKFAALAVWPHMPNAIRGWRDRTNPYRRSPFADWCPLREEYAVSSGALARARASQPDFDGYAFTNARRWRDDLWRRQASAETYLGLELVHGIAMPDPTAFLPLIELCAGIPDDQYLRNGTDRWLARRLLRGRVPDMVVDERRRGIQAADWPLRFARERSALLAELAHLRGDPRLANMLDIERMTRDLSEWDGRDEPSARNVYKIATGLTRGVAMARFVRYVEGRNG